MTAAAEYAEAIRELHEAAQKAVRAAKRAGAPNLQSLRMTAHFIAGVADNLPKDDATA